MQIRRPNLHITWLSALLLSGCAEMMRMQTQVQVTSPPTPTIPEMQAVPYTGLKKRVAVMRFENKAGVSGQVEIGSGMAEQLVSSLVKSGRFIVLERLAVDDVLREQDLGMSGRVRPETALKVGEIEGAEFLIYGAVTSFKGDFKGTRVGAGVGQGAAIGAAGGIIGAVIGGLIGAAMSYQEAHVAIDLRIVDARTGRVVNATTVEGIPPSTGGGVGVGVGGGSTSVAFGVQGFYNTPMGQAVRACIDSGVDWVIKNAFVDLPASQPSPQAAVPPAPVQSPATPVPPSISKAPTPPPLQFPQQPTSPQPKTSASQAAEFFQLTGKFNLRETPNGKIITGLEKDTLVAVLEGKGEWTQILLANGQTGWILTRALRKLEPGAGTATAPPAPTITPTITAPTQPTAPQGQALVPSTTSAPSPPAQLGQQTPSKSPPPSITLYVAKEVQLREVPSGRIITSLTKGKAVAYLEEKDPWAKVRLENGQVGWVEKDSLALAVPKTTPQQTGIEEQKAAAESKPVKPVTPVASVLPPMPESLSLINDGKLREAPRGGITATVDKGTQVTILEASETWSRVRLQSGEEGWIETATLWRTDMSEAKPSATAITAPASEQTPPATPTPQ